MINLDKDDTFLARWLSGDLSEAERLAFEQDPDFPKYQKIAETAAQFHAPETDLESFRRQLLAHLPEKGAQAVRRVRLIWPLLAAAAVLAGLLTLALPGVWRRSPEEMVVTTLAGEQKTVTLPDGSTVRLNAGSELRFQKNGFSEQRKVRFTGEGFFKVQKKPAMFTVWSGAAKVDVLGTNFDVKNRPAADLELRCYEGTVRVDVSRLAPKILRGGEGARLSAGVEWAALDKVAGQEPGWMTGMSEFENAPLSTVLEEIAIQYGVSMEYPDVGQTLHTGAFPHNNLETALKIVCGAHDLRFRMEGKKVVVTR